MGAGTASPFKSVATVAREQKLCVAWVSNAGSTRQIEALGPCLIVRAWPSSLASGTLDGGGAMTESSVVGISVVSSYTVQYQDMVRWASPTRQHQPYCIVDNTCRLLNRPRFHGDPNLTSLRKRIACSHTATPRTKSQEVQSLLHVMGCGCSTHVKEVEYNKQPNDTHSGKKRAPNLGEGKTFHSDVGNEESAFVGALAKQGSVKDFRSKYDLSQATELGHGACGSVVAVKRRDTGDLYAMKTVTLDSMGVDSFDELNIEIDLQKRLDHPNICKIIESFEDRKRGIMYIIMELCTGGSLVSRMKTHRKGYGERAAATLVEKMLSAIIYCHHHGVVHRDIKLDNMIYEHEGENNSPLALQLRLTSHLRSPHMSHLSPLTSHRSPPLHLLASLTAQARTPSSSSSTSASPRKSVRTERACGTSSARPPTWRLSSGPTQRSSTTHQSTRGRLAS